MPVFLRDTYTRATDTLLGAHTPDIGGAYTRRPISSGGTERDGRVTGGTGNLNAISGDFMFTNAAAPAGTDYSITDTWTPSGASFFARVFNFISNGNFVQFVIDRYSGEMRFERLNTWTPTTLGTPYVVSMPNGSPVTPRVEVTVEGSNKRYKAFVGGVERINVLDTSPLSGVGLTAVRMDGGDATIGEAEDLGGAGGTANGVTLSAAASLLAGTASAGASATAPGRTLTAAASLLYAGGTLQFQAAGMEFGRRTGLALSTFALDASANYRFTVHADGLVLGAPVFTSGVVSTDSAGRLPNLISNLIAPGVLYRVVAIRQADGESTAAFRMRALA